MEGFGQTETTLTVCNIVNMIPKPGSIGKPSLQYEVDLLDPEGNICPTGVTGEICIKTNPYPDGLMDCYYRNQNELTVDLMILPILVKPHGRMGRIFGMSVK